MSEDIEEWRPVVGYEGLYEVSDHGRVRSLVLRHCRGSRPRKEPKEIGSTNQDGYRKAVLYAWTGRPRTQLVHILVIQAFVGGKTHPDHEVRHLNGDKLDNRPRNLAWGTKKENAADRVAHGRQVACETHYRAKLTTDAVREIRRTEVGLRSLAERFGVSCSTIEKVRARSTWARVS